MSLEWAWLRDTGVRHSAVQEIQLRGKAPGTVLLFHGLTGAPIELAYIAYYLHHRGGLSVSCPAMVNHGQPLAVLAGTKWRELWDGARGQFLQAHARAKTEGVPLFVGGLSIGALLALMLAAEFPDKVAGVACLSPTLFYDGWNVPWFHRFLPFVDFTPFKYFLFLREGHPYGLKDEVLREKMRAKYEATSVHECRPPQTTYAHFPIQLFCECRHLISQGMKMLPGVKAPLLVVQSAQDDSTSPANARYVLEHVSSQDRRLMMLEGSLHIVTADLEREKVADAMLQFFLDPGAALPVGVAAWPRAT
jgi:carboxylesterase